MIIGIAVIILGAVAIIGFVVCIVSVNKLDARKYELDLQDKRFRAMLKRRGEIDD